MDTKDVAWDVGPGHRVADGGNQPRRWLSVGAVSGGDGRDAGRRAARDQLLDPLHLLPRFVAALRDPCEFLEQRAISHLEVEAGLAVHPGPQRLGQSFQQFRANAELASI